MFNARALQHHLAVDDFAIDSWALLKSAVEHWVWFVNLGWCVGNWADQHW